MANHKSALKRARQNENRRVRNRINKTRVKNVTKKMLDTIDQTPDQADQVLREAMKVIGRAASKGTLHRRTAARRIARLSRRVFKAQAGGVA